MCSWMASYIRRSVSSRVDPVATHPGKSGEYAEKLGSTSAAGHLGSGGMGEVYQAADTNLKREVPLKVLPASVAADAGSLARFQREAEVLAALNHPNTAQTYGLEKSNGIIALVMELVGGDDLSQRIAKGAIPRRTRTVERPLMSARRGW